MSSFVRALRPGSDSRPPLFCIHPVSGDSRSLAELAAASRSEAAWLGIDDPALHGENPAATLDERVERYAAAVASMAAGPVHLFGWSTGGAIAAELSQRLLQTGVEMGRLLIVDTRVPQPEMQQREVGPERIRAVFVEASARWAGLEPRPRKTLPDLDAVETELRALGLAVPDREALAHRVEVLGANLRAYFRHQPRQLSATVTLFETEDEHPEHPRPPTLGWEAIAANIDRRTTPGTHFTAVFGAHAPVLARAIDELIAA